MAPVIQIFAMLRSTENLQHEYNQLLTWADLYGKSSFEAKKMIISQFIKAIRVGRDYDIEIVFNVSFEEFSRYGAESAKIRDATIQFASA